MFTDNFVPGIGGTENVVLKLATELSKMHQVLVVAPNYHKDFDDSIFPFETIRVKSIVVSKNDCFAMPAIDKKLKERLRNFKIDVIHVHTLGALAGFAIKFAKKNNIPVVSTIHTKYRYCFKHVVKLPILVNMLTKRIMKRANNSDRVTSVSECMRRELSSYGLRKELTIVRNGNDIKEPMAEKISREKFVILYVGLIADFKNLPFSLESILKLKEINPNFVFCMIGQGPSQRKYKKFIAKKGLKEHVIMTGPIIDKDEIKKYYQQADLLLFTSFFDSDGLVVIEAAQNKTPALVLEGMGATERIVDNKTGFIEKPNQQAVADRINRLMEDRELLSSVGENAHNISIPWQTIVSQYEAIYVEEIEKKGLNQLKAI